MPDPIPTPTPAPAPGDPGAAPDPLLVKLDALAEQITKAHATLDRLERARRIDDLLRAARPSDHALAAELVEHTLAESAGKLTPEGALEQVRRRRPSLFRPAASASPAMSPRAEPTGRDTPAELASRVAAGDHRAILAFMRSRRGG